MLSATDNETITRTGPGTHVGELFRRFWLPALLPSELPHTDSDPLRIRLLGEDLVAFRDTDGHVGVIQNNCPHRGASLFFGRNEEAGIRCVYHGWKFDVSGQCVDMPNEPAESDFRSKVRATAYPTREWAGVVWVYMGPPGLEGDLPRFEWTGVPPENRYIGKYVVDANWLQVIEGSIDTAHTAFLHRGPSTLEHKTAPRPMTDFSRDIPPHFSATETEYGVQVIARRDLPDHKTYWRITQVFLPSYSMIPADPNGNASLVATVPIDDVTCYSWKWTWHPRQAWTDEQVADMAGGSRRRIGGITYPELVPGTLRTAANAANDYRINRDWQRTLNFTGIAGQSEQDLAVQESMGPICNRTVEHLGSTDLGIIATRRRVLKAARDLQTGVEPPAARGGELYHLRSAAVTIDSQASLEDDPSVLAAMTAQA
jgi:phenylpropionate dioxygenase-like ring-hydroxylating dioxygenase large terminal subunit